MCSQQEDFSRLQFDQKARDDLPSSQAEAAHPTPLSFPGLEDEVNA